MSGPTSRRCARLGGGPDRFHDEVIAGAPAQVPRDRLPDLGVGGPGVFLEQRLGYEHHARRAEPALQTVVIPERLLHGVQRVAVGDALDGGDARAVQLNGKHEAGAYGLPVVEHRARAAHAVLAAHVRAREPEALAKKVGESEPRLDRALVAVPVHRDGDGARCHARPARSAASVSARVTSVRPARRRYAAVACRSESGSISAAARVAASAMTSAEGRRPVSAASASRARTGVAPAPKSDTRARSTSPPRVVSTAATPT